MIILYIDPGTGMIIIQLLVSAFAAVGIFYKRVINFFKNLFKNKK